MHEKSKEIASLMKMCNSIGSLMHYKVRPSNYLFQLFLTLYGRPEENSSYFSNVQPCVHWVHLLSDRIRRYTYSINTALLWPRQVDGIPYCGHGYVPLRFRGMLL